MDRSRLVLGLVTGLLMVAILACGGSSGPDPEILDALAPVCEGGAVAEAALYTGGEGLHPVVLLDGSGDSHRWTGQVPSEWWPESVGTTELVVCVGEEQEVLIETCPYIGGPPIDRYQYVIHVELVAAQTGEMIAADDISGDAPRQCRQSEPVELVRLEGSHVAFSDVRDWLTPYVSP